MVLLCFVLDMCSLSPPLLQDLKQCLLELANHYAISSSSSHNRSNSLPNRIALSYFSKLRISRSAELRVAYSPVGSFSLRDFHRAVNTLPDDTFFSEINSSGTAICSCGEKLSSVLSDQVLYSWGDKDVTRKVIVLTSCLTEMMNSETRHTLMDAADKCVSVEFVVFEQSSSHLFNMQENANHFMRSLSDLDNCSFHVYLPDTRVLHRLVKGWLQELRDDMEESIQACFVFESNIVGSVNRILCNLLISVSQIVDGFNACKTCKCHGILLDNVAKDKLQGLCCPVTGQYLETSEVMENSIKVGDKTILFVPSLQKCVELQQVSMPIAFNIIERTNLMSLSEGLLSGSSYFVTPSACHDLDSSSEETDCSELNAKSASKVFLGKLVFVHFKRDLYAMSLPLNFIRSLCDYAKGILLSFFQGICSTLHSMDQGLVCSSYCNLDSMTQTAFCCFYILLPSENGPMLLRRLAGSEEALPIPDVNQYIDSPVSEEIQSIIQASLLKMDLREYNPILHRRGLHQKLSLLVKESIQLGSVLLNANEPSSQTDSHQQSISEVAESNHAAALVVEEKTPHLKKLDGEDKTTTSIAEEWELLVVNDIPKIYSPTCVLNPKMDQFVLSPSESTKHLDAKTSRILERLEAPRQLKRKVPTPTLASNSNSEASVLTEKPLIPLKPNHSVEKTVISSQLIKPKFQKLIRKHK